MPAAFQGKLTYRDLAIALAIVLLAFVLRAIVVFDRAAADPAFATLPPGTDQRTYVILSEALLEGRWPTEPFFHQPGIIYFLAGARAVVGGELGTLRLVTALVGALTVGLMAAVGWLLTGRKWGGYVTALLMAIYPVAIFYATVLLIPVLAMFLVALFLLLALWQLESLALWRTVALGLTVGLLAVTRTNLLLLALTWPLLLVLYHGRGRRLLLHSGVCAFFAALTIAPVAAWNMRTGDGFQLVGSAGLDEVYRANNRDATGVRSHDPAMDTVDDGFSDALIDDIRRNPRRFFELQIRKAGLYWSELEPGNNIDYLKSGEAASPLLRAIPLDFRILAFIGGLGVMALFHSDRRQGIFFTAVNLLIFAGVLVIWVEGRLKQPATVPLIASSGYALVYFTEAVRAQRWRLLLRRYAPLAAALLVTLVFLDWAIENLPRNRPIAALPADVRRLDLVFDDNLHLLGWRPLPEWPAARQGWSSFERSYVIELFWQLDEPAATDYNTFLKYLDNGQRYAGRDRVIGGMSFHPWPTSKWQPGEIYAEIMGFRLSAEIPPARSAEIRLGVYTVMGDPKDEANRELDEVRITSAPGEPTDFTLQHLAVFNLPQSAELPADIETPQETFGDRIALAGYTPLPSTLPAGATIPLALYWRALVDLDADYTVFLHITDETGAVVSQYDSPPLDGRLFTANLPPNFTIRDQINLPSPATPGSYQVFAGLYNTQTLERLPVAAPDNRLPLGSFVVERAS